MVPFDHLKKRLESAANKHARGEKVGVGRGAWGAGCGARGVASLRRYFICVAKADVWGTQPLHLDLNLCNKRPACLGKYFLYVIERSRAAVPPAPRVRAMGASARVSHSH
ncbi:hypothetical protein EVAR_53162_1 [Eumeta japonica]|uniref:Uncharacterized protein n=1 Tax=Eumeta variegata TaxID=151549 RepID=A0A4C1YYJ7_EUMVA|nr:hypothetical protein EVAR_53162_1 [Eumeta japonica]